MLTGKIELPGRHLYNSVRYKPHMDWTEFEPGNQQRDVSVTSASIAWPYICSTFRIVYKVVPVRSELNFRQRSLLRKNTGTLSGYLPGRGASRSLQLRKDTPSSHDTRLKLCSLHSGDKQTATGRLSHEDSKQEWFTDTQYEAGMCPQVATKGHAELNSYSCCSDFNGVFLVQSELLYKAITVRDGRNGSICGREDFTRTVFR